jgi:tetratricopeptide (TPR) repeat protein
MAIETSWVDALKAIPDVVRLIPDSQKFPALAVLVLLIIIVAILPYLKTVPPAVRAAAVTFIIRYAFIGVGVISIASFANTIVSIKSTSAEVQKGIAKSASAAANTSRSPVPVVPPDAIANLANSLVLLSYRLNPPPGINAALAQLKAGNSKPAIDILNNNILAEQKDNVSRAATLRQIALLEFYNNTKASLATYQQSVALDPDSWEAWGQIAYLLERSGDHAGATSAAQKAIDIGNKIHDMNALGSGYGALGYIAANAGRVDDARSFLDKARGNFLAAGSRLEYAQVTSNLARLEFSQGNYEDATRYFQEALSIDSQLNNQRGIAADYSGLGSISLEEGRDSGQFDEALDYFAKSAAANESVGDPHQAALALSGQCSVYLDRHGPGDIDKADHACAQALKLEQQIDNRVPQTIIMGLLAKIAEAKGDFIGAEAKYLEVIAIANSINPFSEAIAQRGLGMFYVAQGKFMPALDAFSRAVEIDRQLSLSKYAAVDQSWLGVVFNGLQRKKEACDAWTESAKLYDKAGVQDEIERINVAKAGANCT